MLEELEEVPSVAPIGLRFSNDHGPDLGRLAHEDGVTESVHEALKPLGIASGLDADRDGWPACTVETFDGVAVMGEFVLHDFARGCVENRDLLFSRAQITSDECHEIGLLLGSGVTVPQPNPINSGRPFS